MSTLRQSFDQNLTASKQKLLDLGYLIETTLAQAVLALTTQDIAVAHQIVARTRTLVNQQSAIETEILSLIATQQPVAGDLRLLVALLEISVELEHLASYITSVAGAAISLNQEALLPPFQRIIPAMVELDRQMLRQSLAALAQYDVILARSIPAQDDAVDHLYQEFCRALTAAIHDNPQAAIQATIINRVAHNLERTADRVINICEWVIFAVTGEMKELNLNSN